MNLVIEKLQTPSVEDGAVEIVERKGKGHPDTLCDKAVEQFSRRLSTYYLEHSGRILHHNVDKGVLRGGRSRVELGGGEVLEPMHFLIVGRATDMVKGELVPLEEIADRETRRWLQEDLPNLRVERDVRVTLEVRSPSKELASLTCAPCDIPLSNDTSFGAGFAPLSETELVVYQAEQYLNSPQLKSQLPQIGEDVKVLGLRRGNSISLTVAAAFIAQKTPSEKAYLETRDAVEDLLRAHLSQFTARDLNIKVNAADRPSENSFYLTITGTSAEAGDDGQVGRGNRYNGLITPYRPMSMEALAGKNPYTHVGKLYNIAATEVAKTLLEDPRIREAHCWLASCIGAPITEPDLVHVRVRAGRLTPHLEAFVQNVAEEILSSLPNIWKRILDGTLKLY